MTKKTAGTKNTKAQTKLQESKPATEEQQPNNIDLDDEDAGFSGWLRYFKEKTCVLLFFYFSAYLHIYYKLFTIKSAEGLDTMKLFVIANSIVMVTTVVIPHLQIVFDILYDVLYGPDSFIDTF